MYRGNVVKYNKNLYVVKDVEKSENRIERVELIPFTNNNCVVVVSRKYPRKRMVFSQECINGECDHFKDEFDCNCPYKEVIDENRSVDSIKVVSSTIRKFIMSKFEKLLFSE